MNNFIIYSKKVCPYCDNAKALLKSKGYSYTEVMVDQDQDALENMIKITNRRTVPQIFFGQYHIGGFDDLVVIEQSGELEKIVNESESLGE